MKKFPLIIIVIALFISNQLVAQDWRMIDLNEVQSKIGKGTKEQLPSSYELFHFDFNELKSQLQHAPEESINSLHLSTTLITFPFADGHVESFRMRRVYYMHKDLSILYPEIQSYVGISTTNPLHKIYISLSSDNFYGVIVGEQTIYLDPYKRGLSDYLVAYDRKFHQRAADDDFVCHYIDEETSNNESDLSESSMQRNSTDGKFRTYNIAIACTSAYSAYHGNTIPSVLAAMNTTITRINSVFEVELGVRFQIIPNNNRLIYINGFNTDATPDPDPYDNYSGSQMLGENTSNINGLIGSAAYHIGHVFSTGGGGIAGTGPCSSTSKARGVTGIVTPEFDPFDIDYVAHEIAHQFSAGHTYYNPCFGSKVGDDYEPGSASTILGYAGICTPNVQSNSDSYFHARSIAQMTSLIASHTCEIETSYPNSEPVANAGPNYTIPKGTPFILNGNLSYDPDFDDVLTYCWEQYDNTNGGAQPPLPTNTVGPIFRSLPPSIQPERVFPNLEAIIANETPTWEVLPSVGRTLNFRLTVRDNNAFVGQTNSDDVALTVSSSAGPFVVSSPNIGNEIWYGGETKTITWNVNNTATLSANVNIKLSLDGGYTYPITLAANTPNDGTQAINVPDVITQKARIKVEAASNIFFDISNQDFEIKSGSFEFVLQSPAIPACKPNATTFTFTYNKAPLFNELVTFSLQDLPVGVSASISPASLSDSGEVTITLDGISSLSPTNYPLQLVGSSTNTNQSIPVVLNVYEDFIDALSLHSPINGAMNLTTDVSLSWHQLTSAEEYIVELSESPVFTSLVETTTTSRTEYQTTSLQDGKIYFWRVRPKNSCLYGSYSEVYTFQTAQDVCNTYTNEYFENNDNVWNTGSNNAVSARIDVTDNLIINKTTFYMRATHPLLSDIKMQFRAPNGLFAEVYNRDCSGANFNVTFDDDGIPLTCGNVVPNVTAGLEGVQQPGQPFSKFNGSNAQGTWTLLATDRVSNSSGGTFHEFSITICGKLQIVNNITLTQSVLPVNQGATQVISSSFLQATQPNATAAQLEYVVTKLPTEGYLLLNGQRLFVGDTFTQATIQSGLLSYKHNGVTQINDSFTATVKGINLALLGGQIFTLAITPEGCSSTTIWNGSTWSNGSPTKNKNVVFNANFTTSSSMEACSLSVNGNAVVTLASGTNFTVNHAVSVAPSASLLVENNANLVQVSHVANTGIATVNRNSTPIIRLDYTVWSSPVANQNLLSFSPQTLTNRFYIYNPLYSDLTSYEPIDPTLNDFIPSKGYYIRAPNNWSSTNSTIFNGTFVGTPNNAYLRPVIKKSNTSGYNSVGNPYPSAIDATTFILKNTFTRGTENQTIDGTLYFWTHTLPAVAGSYPLNNYASYTLLGGTASVAGGETPNGVIQTGQGFIVNALVPSYLSFSNEMRLTNNENQFFRAFNPTPVAFNSNDKHRIWLRLKNDTHQYSQALIGYMHEATDGHDYGIDGYTFGNNGSRLYSLMNNDKYAIQGKALPFDDSDSFPIGITIVEPGNYEIAIDQLDGIFQGNQEIYLRDHLLQVVHDLKSGAYTFYADEQETLDRFDVLFKNEVLATGTFDQSSYVVYQHEQQTYIQANNDIINEVIIHDLLGRKIIHLEDVNTTTVSFPTLSYQKQVLLITVINQNHATWHTKILVK